MSQQDELVEFGVTDDTPMVRFLASLSDGRTVIQDVRGCCPAAWTRLQEWLNVNPGITITGLRLQGPQDREFTMPGNQQGYFIGNKQRKIMPGGQATYVGIGYYDGNSVEVSWYQVPSFAHSFTESRSVAKSGFFLIKN